MDILDNPPKKKAPREASLWAQLKSNLPRGWYATRLESRATLGVPDVIFMDDLGGWHMVELKTTDRPTVKISAHQVAFQGKHDRGSCWMAVLWKDKGLYLFKGNQAVDLKLEGMSAEHHTFLPLPVDWERFYKTLAS